MFCYSAVSTWTSNFKWVLFECWKKRIKKKSHCLFLCACVCARVCLRTVLSFDGTCPAPCCGCSHWAVITHLTAVWNIHRQVSPSLWVSHMDCLLSPPLSALTPWSLYSTWLLLHPTHLSASGYTLHSHPVLSLELEMTLSHSLLNFFSYWFSVRIRRILHSSAFRKHVCILFAVFHYDNFFFF